MHFQCQALTSTKIKSRRDCLGQQEFLCCNCSLSTQKPISHNQKEEEEEKGRCSREKQQLTLSEFMRKETLGRERTDKDQRVDELQGPFLCFMTLPEQSELQNQPAMNTESKINDFKICLAVSLWQSHMCFFFTMCFHFATTHQWVNMFLASESHLNPQCLVAFPLKNSVGLINNACYISDICLIF